MIDILLCRDSMMVMTPSDAPPQPQGGSFQSFKLTERYLSVQPLSERYLVQSQFIQFIQLIQFIKLIQFNTI